jgi:hypothetical protein
MEKSDQWLLVGEALYPECKVEVFERQRGEAKQIACPIRRDIAANMAAYALLQEFKLGHVA